MQQLLHENTPVHKFFLSQDPEPVVTPLIASSTLSNTYAALQAKLPSPWFSGATCSECIFAITIGILPASLTIGTGDKFFLFMDLHVEKRWVSYEMTAQKWVNATTEYNICWKHKCQENGTIFVSKNPRVLIEKLGEMEIRITE
ncbi:hypothetical protein K439DRAFT_1375483 [Ramaria rubella]|nr:hypothetical protein K439DRAFT_1375483 [Ramaria rubella]